MDRWDREGVPHKGWVCIDMEDLGEFVGSGEMEYEQCEMCGKEKIRYVHIMKHIDGSTLRVGSGCAAKMEVDYSIAYQRERDAKNRANRRDNFLKQRWTSKDNGNFVLNYKGNNITIVKNKYRAGYGVAYNREYIWEYKGIKMMDLNIAKRAAFDLFETL